MAVPALAALTATAAAGLFAAPAAHAADLPTASQQTLTAAADVTDGATVGVGMPVSLTFNQPVIGQSAQRAVAAHITVEADDDQQAVAHWFGSQRLDFRPRTYWKPGTTVTVHLGLDGVRAGAATGTTDQAITFHIGRARTSVVDVRSKTLRMFDGKSPIAEFPITAGGPDTPTHNGAMVISEKDPQTRMDATTVKLFDDDGTPAYDIPDVPHALRLTASGTFLHGNYWSAPNVFGARNTSHGCIGLKDVKGGSDPSTPAAWIYDHSMVGDVVVVRGAEGSPVAPDNGLGDWNMSWAAWTEGITGHEPSAG
ncbi:L,D-transpeptidase [Streptomyces vinaceus]|uniref:L,D-transpeptidase n=1 Tax=Streptomyces vinaceus TaxID=1960 RepID=UPI0035D7C042